jgi:hypothetical protein
LREQPDVEAEVAGAEVLCFLLRGEEVYQERREARLLQHPRDVAIPGAIAARTGAVGEEHDALSTRGHSQAPFELDLAC